MSVTAICSNSNISRRPGRGGGAGPSQTHGALLHTLGYDADPVRTLGETDFEEAVKIL